MDINQQSNEKTFDVIIVGAGASGMGVAIVLDKIGIDYLILERDTVGASFRKWPKETRFISPSFTGNFFGMPDLNAISPETSPAYNLLTEHPSGEEYAQYLEGIAEFYQLKIETKVAVQRVQKETSFFRIKTDKGDYKSRCLIWAAGEFQYPSHNGFTGADLCTHYSQVTSFSDLQGAERLVIGGYESGFDASVHLVESGKRVTVLDSSDYLGLVSSDSSYALSPYTRDRIKGVIDQIDYHKETRVEEVRRENGHYRVTSTDGKTFTSVTPPINCTGFDSSLSLVKDLFEFEGQYPLLTDFDESTKTENLFLVGPQVKHGGALFCFIYKYRQRFAIVGEKIAMELGVPPEIIEEFVEDHKQYNFYLKDLSCCGDSCDC